ncbi:hypothetical protein DY000_02013441 [Brassica cretica]|uniref:Jacalin-type lectin domain-containing protein n=1 Tax=Brassica cretica TaxID=69181 RepID=A0ABQ7D8Q2_BRACR|nr:hypothetical protein DY000_02013441 [Brassica cretica]
MGDELITTKIAEEEHSNFKPLMARARTTIDVTNRIFRRNSEETNFRGNSEDHQFVGKLLGIYRGRNSGYFDGLSDGPILGSSDEIFLGIFIGKFRGTGPSENSEERGPSEYSEEHVPRYILRNMSLGIFRGTCPSVYSEERGPSVYSEEDVPRYIPRVHFLGI